MRTVINKPHIQLNEELFIDKDRVYLQEVGKFGNHTYEQKYIVIGWEADYKEVVTPRSHINVILSLVKCEDLWTYDEEDIVMRNVEITLEDVINLYNNPEG